MAARLWLVQSDTLPPPPAGTTSMWPLIGGLLGFAAILLLSYLGLRFISRRNLLAARGRHMQVVDRMVVGRDSSILLVRVGGKVLVTGMGKDGFRTLSELDAGELESGEWRVESGELKSDSPVTPETAQHSAPDALDSQFSTLHSQLRTGFLGRFWHNLKVNAGLMPKGTPPSRPEPAVSAAGEVISFQDALKRSREELEHPIEEAPVHPVEEAPEQSSATDAPLPTPDTPSSIPDPRFSILRSQEQKASERLPIPPDYNRAIERMRSFGRMEIEAKRREEPSAIDNLAFLQAARAYAAHQRTENQKPEDREETPELNGASQRSNIEMLSERVRKRTQRLTQRLAGRGEG